MKIRQGFVSNSSSSSFCIYGITVEESEVKEALIAKGATEEDFADGLYEFFDSWSYDYKKREGKLTAEDIAEQEAKFFQPGDGFDFHSPYDYGEIYLGVEWSSIGDDETGSQFRARIEAKLTELFGKETSCSTLEEAWRDG
jgi:hypothetical protein